MSEKSTYRTPKRPLHAGRALRYGRIAAAAVMLATITVLLTASGASVALALGWTARIQIVPMAMAGAIAGLVGQALAALVFGRIYCSTICPLGTVQDITARIPRMGRNRWIHPWHYMAPRTALRWTMLGLTVVAGVCSIAIVPSLLDPYSTYARFASEWLRPVAATFQGEQAMIASGLAAVTALAVMAAVAALAWRGGRTVCNTVCPAGTFLGLFSRYSLLHIDIDTDLCVNCRKCEHICKGHCIDLDSHTVDGSRCVMCFDCTAVCPEEAITYTTRRKRLSLPMMQRVDAGTATSASSSNVTENTVAPTSSSSQPIRISRRGFMATGLILASAPLLARAGKILAPFDATPDDSARYPIAPPGRRTLADFHQKCTACGLCVSHCPGHVLRPAGKDYGWRHSLQPLLDYDRGRCLYDCTLCTELCPTGALEPLTVDEKHIFIIGHAYVEPDLCVGCGACAWTCPRQVIKITSPEGRRRRLAVVGNNGCIGCGACQDVCPVKPVKAIRVNGIKPD